MNEELEQKLVWLSKVLKSENLLGMKIEDLVNIYNTCIRDVASKKEEATEWQDLSDSRENKMKIIK